MKTLLGIHCFNLRHLRHYCFKDVTCFVVCLGLPESRDAAVPARWSERYRISAGQLFLKLRTEVPQTVEHP